MAMTFTELAEKFGSLQSNDGDELATLELAAWELLQSVVSRVDWAEYGMTSPCDHKIYPDWNMFVYWVGVAGNVRDAHPGMMQCRTNRKMEDWKAKASVSQKVCLWMDQASTESLIQRLARLAVKFSCLFAWEWMWELRGMLESKAARLSSDRKRLLESPAPHESLQLIYDESIRELEYAMVIHNADLAVERSHLSAFECGLRKRFPRLLESLPVVDVMNTPRPSNQELLGYCNQCRKIESALLVEMGQSSPSTPEEQTPVTRGRIIPAEPPTAFWYLERHLADLLFTIPAPEPLTSEWLDEMRKTTHAKVGRAVSSVDHYSPNEQLRGKIHKASTKALQLATLLRESPSLSSIPRREWTVPSEGQLFDDLAKLQHEFETLGNTDNWSQAGGKWLLNPDQEAAGETPAVATGQPSAIPSRWIPIILDLQDRFTSDEGRFSEGEFSKKHSHIEGCSPCLAVLESLGVIGEKKFANLAEETGPLSAVLPSYDDVREIHPTIMTHPDLKGLATQGANPAKDAKGGEEDWSKAYPMKAWIIVFNSAGSLGEKSDRTFRDWVKEQVNQGNASRESPKAPVRFKVSVLKRLNVDPPDVK